jgi:hypothetical protein
MKLTDAHTITAVVVEYTQGNGRKTLGQVAIEDLPIALRQEIIYLNVRTKAVTYPVEEK